MGTEAQNLTYHVITYNIAEIKKPTEDLSPILALDQKPDVISIGLEESGDFDLLPDEEKDKADPWSQEFDSLLGEKGYYIVDITSVFQVKLRVYVLKKHMHAISHVEAITAKSGFVGGVKNIFKAAAIVRFRCYGKHIAIINTHLTAFDERTLDRNTEYWQFFADQEFEDDECEELYHHDYIVWSGDLNYRIEFDNTQTRQLVSEGRYRELLQYDQLRNQQSQGLAFVGFQEGEINFAPSYKFDLGTDVYDTSKKQRVPSWCDRVLYRVKLNQERVGSLVNWAPTMDTVSSDDSIPEEISKKSAISQPATPQLKKGSLFKKKVMRKQDSTLRKEEMRRKTLGVLRKTSMLPHDARSPSPETVEEKIELHAGDITDQDKFEDLLAKIDKEGVNNEEKVKVLSYTSYPEMKLSDHKPVAATLGISFPSPPTVLPKLQVDKGSKCKVLISIEGLGKVNPPKDGHWLGLYKKYWVKKVSHISFVYLQKRKKPKGKFSYKATFGASSRPKSGEIVQAVYYMSKDYSRPSAFIEFKCP